MPSRFFRLQGTFHTYCTSRWSQNGTRTSRPTIMLSRSFRSSSSGSQRVSP